MSAAGRGRGAARAPKRGHRPPRLPLLLPGRAAAPAPRCGKCRETAPEPLRRLGPAGEEGGEGGRKRSCAAVPAGAGSAESGASADRGVAPSLSGQDSSGTGRARGASALSEDGERSRAAGRAPSHAFLPRTCPGHVRPQAARPSPAQPPGLCSQSDWEMPRQRRRCPSPLPTPHSLHTPLQVWV